MPEGTWLLSRAHRCSLCWSLELSVKLTTLQSSGPNHCAHWLGQGEEHIDLLWASNSPFQTLRPSWVLKCQLPAARTVCFHENSWVRARPSHTETSISRTVVLRAFMFSRLLPANLCLTKQDSSGRKDLGKDFPKRLCFSVMVCLKASERLGNLARTCSQCSFPTCTRFPVGCWLLLMRNESQQAPVGMLTWASGTKTVSNAFALMHTFQAMALWLSVLQCLKLMPVQKYNLWK